MSNYTQTTFFTPKDSLPITDPNKTIFGAAYDVEFANISAALATKIDSVFTNPTVLSINVTSSGIPANGMYLPSANTLGFATNSAQRMTISPIGVVTMTANGFAGGILNVIGSNNTSVDIIVQNTTSGNNSSTVVAVQDSTTNFGFMELQGPLCAAAVTNGVTGSVVNIGSNAVFPVQLCTNNAVVATLGGSGGMTVGAPTGGNQGAGTINTTGLFVNGVQVGVNGGISVSTSATNISAMAVGAQNLIYAAAPQSVTTNTAIQTDTTLQFTNVQLSAGQSYLVEAWLVLVSTTAAVGYNAGFNSTATSTTQQTYAYGMTGAATSGSGLFGNGSNVTPGQSFIGRVFTTGSIPETVYVSMLLQGTNGVSSNGTVSAAFAQFASSATAVTRNAGSMIKITRVH